MKAVVSGIFILEVVQVILTSHDAFRMFATGWGDPLQLDNVGLLWFSVPIMNALSEHLFLHFFWYLTLVPKLATLIKSFMLGEYMF